jgi:hypothetical protein
LVWPIKIICFGPNWNRNQPGLKFPFTPNNRSQPLCRNLRIEAWTTRPRGGGSTRPVALTRPRGGGSTRPVALTRPARRRRTAPTTTLPAAFSPVRICSLPSLSYPLLSRRRAPAGPAWAGRRRGCSASAAATPRRTCGTSCGSTQARRRPRRPLLEVLEG